jgi:hypothetical protein
VGRVTLIMRGNALPTSIVDAGRAAAVGKLEMRLPAGRHAQRPDRGAIRAWARLSQILTGGSS